MQESTIYRVLVESAYGGSQWRGVFSEIPEKADIIEAINLDIQALNPTVEHETDRIRDYQRHMEVVDNVDQMESLVTVMVANIRIGAIEVSEEKIFLNVA